MNADVRNKIISIVLGLIIIALGYWLYDSITGPYQQVLKAQERTEQVRTRMLAVKDALLYYQQQHDGAFPPQVGGLDSLALFLKSDSLASANGDSMFVQSAKFKYSADSLILSPFAPFAKFNYAVNDTSRPPLYELRDPNSDDRIGDLSRTTLLNASSWN